MAAARAELLILPGEAVPGGTRLLGLTLAERAAKASRRAGFGPAEAAGASEAHGAPVRLVLASSDVVAGPAFFRGLLAPEIEGERLLADGPVLVVDTRDVPFVRGLAERLPRVELAGALRERFGAPAVPALGSEAGAFVLKTPADLRAAERFLLRGLVKESEGFMSRHVERKISLAVTRLIAGTSITPNAMTLVSVAVGLSGAAFFLSTRPALELVGALLFLLHSILDGCDGELARLKFLESRWGGVLDFWGDNVVHAAVFLAIAEGWRRAIDAPWPLLLGLSAAAGTFLSAAFVYRTTMTGAGKDGPLFTSVSSGPPSRVTRLADALARRDFIYLVVLLSAFGKAHWFLVLGSIGAPAFFAVLAGASLLARVERRVA